MLGEVWEGLVLWEGLVGLGRVWEGVDGVGVSGKGMGMVWGRGSADGLEGSGRFWGDHRVAMC